MIGKPHKIISHLLKVSESVQVLSWFSVVVAPAHRSKQRIAAISMPFVDCNITGITVACEGCHNQQQAVTSRHAMYAVLPDEPSRS